MAKIGTEKWKNNHFVLEIEGISSPAIDEVTGISLGEAGTVEIVDAGTNLVEKISSGIVRFQPLTLMKIADGTQADRDWLAWFTLTFDLNNPTANLGSQSRKNGAIIKKEYGVEVARFAFVGGWIKSFTAPDLASGNEEVARYTIVLEHQGLFAELL